MCVSYLDPLSALQKYLSELSARNPEIPYKALLLPSIVRSFMEILGSKFHSTVNIRVVAYTGLLALIKL